MKSAILSVGTELLFGQVLNTNTAYLSKQLNFLGIDVMYHYTVGDNPKRLEEMIRMAFEDCDLVITTGGLGPTQDDMTKEIACKTLGDQLVLHQESMEQLEEMFRKSNRVMTENNRKQAYMPSRAVVFDNDAGTAPGFALEKDGKIIACLPGPPREMTRMFERRLKPYLESLSEDCIYYKMIRTFGIGESQLETVLLPLIDGQTDPTIATYAKEGESAVRIASKRKTKEEAMAAVDEMLEKVKGYIGEYIYSCNDEELVNVVANKLMEKGITISSAESCTGGLFAARMTDIPGISQVFDRGLVTYSNQAKMQELGVSRETLEKYGAVSEETAREMAEGLSRVSGSDMCISVTGIAGPGGETPGKPVGTVFVGARYQDKTHCIRLQIRNVNRQYIRNYTVLHMLDLINKLVK